MPVIDFAAARRHMLTGQLLPNQVTDPRLLEAMGAVRRELFVPAAVQGVAYRDEDIPLKPGRFLLEPMVFARLLQEAAIGPNDVVLDVGCGPGYSCAVLARLAATVVGLESDRDLFETAARLLGELGVDNTVIVQGPLSEGLAGQAPYDVIVIEGAVPCVPDALIRQLAEGGRLVTVVRGNAGPGRAVAVLRLAGVVSQRPLFDAQTPLLPEFVAEPGFVF
jgi:protein-L-isoaspartate(D-aspartate) O-methyltransferase